MINISINSSIQVLFYTKKQQYSIIINIDYILQLFKQSINLIFIMLFNINI